MNEICGDNRFEIIAKAKADLLEGTNIETDEAEMAVIDNILFRCWQMGWLDRYDRKTEPTTEDCSTVPTSSKMEQVDKDINVRSKDEPTCDTCRHKGVEGCEQPCLGCGCCGLYEVMTGNDKLKEKVVEFIKTCARCKHRPIGAMMCEESCHYEPQPTTQTGTQNSNLTFEKRTMRDCYNCKRYETEGECIECRYEPKDEPQTERSE